MSDLFDPGTHEFDVTFIQDTQPWAYATILTSVVWGSQSLSENAIALEEISLLEQAAADNQVLQTTPGKLVGLVRLERGSPAVEHFKIILTQSAYLYLNLADGFSITSGASFVGDRQTPNPYTLPPTTHVWRITNPTPGKPPGDTTTPPPPTPTGGPQIVECVFPEMSLNFISVMSGLASWLGCMVRNIIVLIQWIVDWILHFPDHLDAWISRLFGVDPSLPFFDEVLKKIDIWISGKFGVDPEKPFWEELVKKALTWITEVINTSAQNRIQERKW